MPRRRRDPWEIRPAKAEEFEEEGLNGNELSADEAWFRQDYEVEQLKKQARHRNNR